MKKMVEPPTKKRPGHIIMTASGYYKQTRNGPVPYDPSSWRKKKCSSRRTPAV